DELSPFAYNHDVSAAPASFHDLDELLTTVRSAVGPDGHIFLIAHSLGNSLLLNYLSHYSGAPVSPRTIDEIVLAAPDVSVQDFTANMQNIQQYLGHVTLYASCCDKALDLSKDWNSSIRAGQVVNGVPTILIKGVETIDASSVRSGYFWEIDHGYYASDLLLLSDIKALITKATRPPEERSNFLLPVKTDPRGEYWRIP
ncbi:MAG: alpha/beta hydrolase, partial [Alphaproteobacteria bacterium]